MIGEYDNQHLGFTNECVSILENDGSDIIPKNLYITTVFCWNGISERNTTLSSMIPHLFRCDAKIIEIRNQIFTFAEFRFLVESGNVSVLELNSGCSIVTPGKDVILLENILKFLPNIEKMSM